MDKNEQTNKQINSQPKKEIKCCICGTTKNMYRISPGVYIDGKHEDIFCIKHLPEGISPFHVFPF